MTSQNNKASYATLLICGIIAIPACIMVFTRVSPDPVLGVLIFGLGIVGAAFLISWAAEAAQVDISASFAIAILALIAILPEYAVEAVLAWDAGQSYILGQGATIEMERVAANVTGANRLLIGLGWSSVILIFYVRKRTSLNLKGILNLEILMLIIANLVLILIVILGQIPITLGFGLIILYAIYLWLSSIKESGEPELVGPSLAIGQQRKTARRVIVIGLFFYSAFIIVLIAEPFVHALVESGRTLGIDEFILIQWLAPLASESPEIIIAILFTLRSNAVAGLTILISAEVNQLTLLVGSMVGIFSLSFGELTSFPLNDMQSVEFVLTAAVTFLGLIFLAPRIIGWKAGATLLILFVAHLFFTEQYIANTWLGYEESGMWLFDRAIFTYIYLSIATCCGTKYVYRRINRNR